MKIYGETLRPDVPYKTLLLSTGDSVDYVIKEALEKYDLDKEDPADFCLFQVQCIVNLTFRVILTHPFPIKVVNFFLSFTVKFAFSFIF